MQGTPIPHRIAAPARTANPSNESELTLRVVTVYQDALMRYWARGLWDRVGQLLGQRGICHQSWKIRDLTRVEVFPRAVQAAAEADVLVMSIRDTGELPVDLCVWIDAWMSRRAGCAGALVALLGVSPQPCFQSGRVHAYLEAVARRVGLDFLPQERKLPEASSALSTLGSIPPAATLTMPWLGESSAPPLAAA